MVSKSLPQPLMDSFQYSCPGKIFILGEYACLKGTPALIGTLSPFFSLTVNPTTQREKHILKNSAQPFGASHSEKYASRAFPFHMDSPAGKLLIDNKAITKNYHLMWNDPYEVPIGVGSSTAQFLLSMALISHLKRVALPIADEILEMYWKYSWTEGSVKPSGCDLIAQYLGGVLAIKNSPLGTKKFSLWKNNKITWILAFTGEKVKTHEQLSVLFQKGFPKGYETALHILDELILKGIQAWEKENAFELGSIMNQYQDALHKNIISSSFTEQIQKIQKWDGVYGCKGSGAQGGDSVLLFVKQELASHIQNKLQKINWKPFVIEWVTAGLHMAQNQ